MARAGDVIEHPVTTERVRFLKTAQDTNGELLQLEFWTKPGGFVAAAHVHPKQEEHWEILSGAFRIRTGEGTEREVRAGDAAVVPPGVPHAWWNGGDDELHFIVEFRPALRQEEFFESYFDLAQDGETDPKTGLPSLLQMAVMLREFEDEVYLARPSLPVQRGVFGALATVGRLLGYRAHYPYPYAERREMSPAGVGGASG
jgi:quercetin dioxygenase-like cupin family protein